MYIKFLTFVLNDLFTETSKGCKRDVNPSEIMIRLVFFYQNAFLQNQQDMQKMNSKLAMIMDLKVLHA